MDLSNDFLIYEKSFDYQLRLIDNQMIQDITTFLEANQEELYVTESSKNSLWDSLRSFFSKIIKSISNYSKNIRMKMETKIQEKEIYDKLKILRDELKYNKANGIHATYSIDFWQYRDTYLEMNNELWNVAKRFPKMRYSTVEQIKQDLFEFDTMLSKYADKLEAITTEKKPFPTSKLLDFVENELKGKSDVIETLNKSMKEFRELENLADDLRKKCNGVNDSVVAEHVGLIKSVVKGIASFLNKMVSKFIMAIVFLFA